LAAALLVWLFLAGPAAAGIQRYTDSRGVIHISNVPPRQAPAPRGAAAPEPVAALKTPEPVPASAPSAQSPPGAPSEARRLQESSQTVSPPAPTADAWQQPLQKAAGEVAGTFQPSTQELRAAAATPIETVTAGGLRSYRDAAGVWRISNLGPEAADSGPVTLKAERPRSRPEKLPLAPDQALPWQPASFSPGDPEPASWRTQPGPAKRAAHEGVNPIRRHRDRQGVIHISNVVEEEVPPPLELERPPAWARREVAPNRPRRALEDWAADAFKPAAWSGEGIKLASRQSRKAPPPDAASTAGGIRRWRDKQGVWHIKMAEYPWPEGVPVPPRLAGLIPGTPQPEAPRAAAPSGITRASPAAPLSAIPGSGTNIIALRDSKGRLQITNAVPAAPLERGPPLGGTLAPAELEPLIAEAAMINRLPPSLIKAVIKVESNFCVGAVSPKGAMGLMQLMPGTADFLGVREPFNPRENILGGSRYLRLLLDSFGGSLPLALAGYNAGFQRVIDCGYQVPAIRETQDFVTQVMGRYIAEEKGPGPPWT
jgi:hypothetical protein